MDTPAAQQLLVAASAQAETHRLLTSNSLQAVGVKVARFPSLTALPLLRTALKTLCIGVQEDTTDREKTSRLTGRHRLFKP